MELWERSEALDLLDSLLREAAGGGRVAVVTGEAGIGKSTLVSEFGNRCGVRARVLWGGCDRLTTPRALGPLHDIARQTGGVLAEQLSAGAAQEQIFAAFLDELTGPRQRARPVVVLEDVHWADEATLDLLMFLGRRIERVPAILVVTFRDDEVDARHPLRGALAALPNRLVSRVPLPPLTPACVTEQADRAGLDGQRVLALCGGNPLLVTELLKSDGQGVPDVVQDLILDRLRALPAPARDLAELVAVMPTRADAAIVAGVADLVAQCVGGGVLVTAADGVSYRHELLRGAVEDSLLPMRRAALHQRVLDILSRVPKIDPGRLVHHAQHAGDTEAVLRFGQIAGAGAARQGAHREAAAHYGAAAAHADRLSASLRAELLEQYGFEAYLAGLSEAGIAARQTALDIRESLDQPELVGENLRWISRLAWWNGRPAQAREAADRAIAVLETLPPNRPLAMAYSNRSQLHLLAWELDESVEWGRRAVALAERLGDEETAIHATINMNTSLMALGAAGAKAALEDVHSRAAALGFADHAARALLNLSGTLSEELGDIAAAAPVAERALEYIVEHDLEIHLQFMLGVRARIRFGQCDWTVALADTDASLARPMRAVGMVAALVVRGRILSARGHPDALSTLDEALELAVRVGDLQVMCPALAARSEHFLWHGDAERSAAEARHGLALAASSHYPFHSEEFAYRLWRAGEPSRVPDGGTHPYHLMVRGEWAAAAREWGRLGNEFARAQALAGGDEAAASTALRVLDDLGATQAAKHLRVELKKKGFIRVPRGPRPATAAHTAGLTPRQADVLALLAEGLSNAEIAQRLSLSARTVEHHISALLSKLGVSSRGQAAAQVRWFPPIAGQD